MLLECVRSQRIDLADVPLEPICRAVLEYLSQDASQNLEGSAAALHLMAFFLERKAHELLPVETEDAEQATEWLEALEPWVAEFEPAIHHLVGRKDGREQLFFRGEVQGEYELPLAMGEATTLDLARALQMLLRRATPDVPTPTGPPRRSLAQQMAAILDSLDSEFQSLEQVAPYPFTRTEAVWWFLAMLELIRLRKIRVRFEQDALELALECADR